MGENITFSCRRLKCKTYNNIPKIDNSEFSAANHDPC